MVNSIDNKQEKEGATKQVERKKRKSLRHVTDNNRQAEECEYMSIVI